MGRKLTSEAQLPDHANQKFIPQNGPILKRLVADLESFAASLPNDPSVMNESERCIWSAIIEGKLSEHIQTAFNSLDAVEELFFELRPTQAMYDAHRQQPELLAQISANATELEEAKKTIAQLKATSARDTGAMHAHKGHAIRLGKEKDALHAQLRQTQQQQARAAVERDEAQNNSAQHYHNMRIFYNQNIALQSQLAMLTQASKKSFDDLQQKLDAATQERDHLVSQLREATEQRNGLRMFSGDEKVVPPNFKPIPGRSYRFNKNDCVEPDWTCLSINNDGSWCMASNTHWIKMRSASEMWMERVNCVRCKQRKMLPLNTTTVNENSASTPFILTPESDDSALVVGQSASMSHSVDFLSRDDWLTDSFDGFVQPVNRLVHSQDQDREALHLPVVDVPPQEFNSLESPFWTPNGMTIAPQELNAHLTPSIAPSNQQDFELNGDDSALGGSTLGNVSNPQLSPEVLETAPRSSVASKTNPNFIPEERHLFYRASIARGASGPLTLPEVSQATPVPAVSQLPSSAGGEHRATLDSPIGFEAERVSSDASNPRLNDSQPMSDGRNPVAVDIEVSGSQKRAAPEESETNPTKRQKSSGPGDLNQGRPVTLSPGATKKRAAEERVRAQYRKKKGLSEVITPDTNKTASAMLERWGGKKYGWMNTNPGCHPSNAIPISDSEVLEPNPLLQNPDSSDQPSEPNSGDASAVPVNSVDISPAKILGLASTATKSASQSTKKNARKAAKPKTPAKKSAAKKPRKKQTKPAKSSVFVTEDVHEDVDEDEFDKELNDGFDAVFGTDFGTDGADDDDEPMSEGMKDVGNITPGTSDRLAATTDDDIDDNIFEIIDPDAGTSESISYSKSSAKDDSPLGLPEVDEASDAATEAQETLAQTPAPDETFDEDFGGLFSYVSDAESIESEEE